MVFAKRSIERLTARKEVVPCEKARIHRIGTSRLADRARYRGESLGEPKAEFLDFGRVGSHE